MIYLSPIVTGATPPHIMRTIDGRSYEVGNAAQLRTAALDCWRMARAYRAQVRDLWSRMDLYPVREFAALGAALQVDTANVLELAAVCHAQAGLDLGVTIRNAPLEVWVIGGRRYACRTVAECQETARALRADAYGVLQAFGAAKQTITPQPLQWPTVEAEPAPQTMGALPLAYTAAVYTVALVSGVVAVALVLRQALAWYMPEGAGRLATYQQGVRVVEETYRRARAACDTLPEGPGRVACLAGAQSVALQGLDAVNRAAVETSAGLLKKLALAGLVGFVGLKLWQGRTQAPRGSRG